MTYVTHYMHYSFRNHQNTALCGTARIGEPRTLVCAFCREGEFEVTCDACILLFLSDKNSAYQSYYFHDCPHKE